MCTIRTISIIIIVDIIITVKRKGLLIRAGDGKRAVHYTLPDYAKQRRLTF